MSDVLVRLAADCDSAPERKASEQETILRELLPAALCTADPTNRQEMAR